MDPTASNFNPYATAGGGGGGYYQTDISYESAGSSGYPEGGYYGEDPTNSSSAYGYNDNNNEPTSVPPGSYYACSSPLQIASTAISAMVWDPLYMDTIHSATMTLRAGHHGVSAAAAATSSRVSYLSTHTAVSSTTTAAMLYATTPAHPEASSVQLRTVYQATIGGTTTTTQQSGRTTTHRRSQNAYAAPYGQQDPALPDRAVLSGANPQLGITRLQAFAATTTTTTTSNNHLLLSVSPAAVRIHTVGGACVAEYDGDAAAPSTDDTKKNTTTSSSNSPPHFPMAATLAQDDRVVVVATSHNTLVTLDVWQGLRPMKTTTLPSSSSTTTTTPSIPTAMATLEQQQQASSFVLLTGTSDGRVLLFDHRCRSCVARVTTPHRQGVISIATTAATASFRWATTGYQGGTACPDPSVALYDQRYLGRGGFPHAFSGLRGGPRYIAAVPSGGDDNDRWLVASGQVGGGCQVMVSPLSSGTSEDDTFVIPPLQTGEAITAMAVQDDQLALGTNQGRLLPFRMAGYETIVTRATTTESGGGIFVPQQHHNRYHHHQGGNVVATTPAASRLQQQQQQKQPLELPSMQPPMPAVSIDASILLKVGDGSLRSGGNTTPQLRSIFGAFVLTADPVVSSNLGNLMKTPPIGQTNLQVALHVLNQASQHADALLSASSLGINVLEEPTKTTTKSTFKAGSAATSSRSRKSLPNPNKFIYSNTYNKLVYTESLNRMKRLGRRSRRARAGSSDSGDDDEDLLSNIPSRYGLCLRPTHKLAASYNHAEFNHTGIIPGYDYSLTMPNAFVPPVLLLLFFVPEIREAALRHQRGVDGSDGLLTELGFLFHRIDCLARQALLFPAEDGVTAMTALDAWAPSSFISCLAATPEAERFQILDGSPAAMDPPRRPEAFYRFLMYQLDTEIQKGTKSTASSSSSSLIDSLCATSFVSINEFVSGSGPPSKSSTRHLTVELAYDHFYSPEYKEATPPSFGDVLQLNLCRATRLRAWNQVSKSYETIVQRKIVTSLPAVLSLSAACAGRKPDAGLSLWRSSKEWLPEMIEIEMEETGSVVVREWVKDEATGEHCWKECSGSTQLPAAIAQEVTESTRPGVIRRRRYALDAVVSLIRDDMDKSCPEDVRDFVGEEGCLGHHVVHARVSHNMRQRIIQQQRTELKRYLASAQIRGVTDMTLMGQGCSKEVLQKRLAYIDASWKQVNDNEESSWVLVNGFLVTDATIHDAREFALDFKEPSLILFRAIEEETQTPKIRIEEKFHIPIDVLRTPSLASPRAPPPPLPHLNQLPGPGDLIAFDAEFVAVAEEESMLTPQGSKVVVRETRHAIARISLLDGRNGRVLLDNHVLPQEPVTDYLTRFSGIVAADLNPRTSRHQLITATAAYWKLRYWLETRQCIFVGHGVRQDFWTANLVPPAAQLIDTVHLYHQPAQRFVSLRFVTNFVLQRDMQLDTHDSMEDAAAALELYKRAVELKQQEEEEKNDGGEGPFTKLLRELYALGQRTDWKLGMGEMMEDEG